MTMPRLAAMGAYWKEHPPLHIIVAGLAGIKPELPPLVFPPEEEGEEKVSAFTKRFEGDENGG